MPSLKIRNIHNVVDMLQDLIIHRLHDILGEVSNLVESHYSNALSNYDAAENRGQDYERAPVMDILMKKIWKVSDFNPTGSMSRPKAQQYINDGFDVTWKRTPKGYQMRFRINHPILVDLEDGVLSWKEYNYSRMMARSIRAAIPDADLSDDELAVLEPFVELLENNATPDTQARPYFINALLYFFTSHEGKTHIKKLLSNK